MCGHGQVPLLPGSSHPGLGRQAGTQGSRPEAGLNRLIRDPEFQRGEAVFPENPPELSTLQDTD